ncbi:guanylate kinase [Streptomyces sp. BPTC-684]|uniref:guanylate kinase n=1 Tax=Streptomyces sp. BPTC-684 TaxID=3043734 RepID=UPI0024B1EA76|nr:guanylate kinase [Streptomyces sp. BPTC-684]WHM41126.1 guanylate kinase [Streptomyces sp. BPTC-684]
MSSLPHAVVLYGPPAAGKDTVTQALTELDPRYALFQRLKAGPGRTTGYRLTTLQHIEDLSDAGELLYRNARYNAHYAIDRGGVSALVEADRIPVLHMGQVAGVSAVSALPLDWVKVLLWSPRHVTEQRSRDRGDQDVEARLKAWDETRQDLLSHTDEAWSLIIETDQTTPAESALRITEAVSGALKETASDIRSLVASEQP